jgi:hypothetical protein
VRPPQERGERARELPFDAVDPGTSYRREVDDVAAAGLGFELRAHRQAAGDGVQLGELSRGERVAGGDGVGEPAEQRAELVEPTSLACGQAVRGGLARNVDDPVVEEVQQCSVVLSRNALLCRRSLRERSSSASSASPSRTRCRLQRETEA